MNILKQLINPNYRKVQQAQKFVDQVNALEPEIQKLSDEELTESTSYFRKKLYGTETPPAAKNQDQHKNNTKKSTKVIDEEQAKLFEIMPEAYARVREVLHRTADHRPKDVQVMGAYFLARNTVAEMFTGEGKTVVAPMAVYLYSLTGKGVHQVTVNDYLTRRDAEWVGLSLSRLGATIGAITPQSAYKFVSDEEALKNKDPDVVKKLLSERDPTNFSTLRGANLLEVSKTEAYLCDVTYGTSSELGFDYLRDNMVAKLSQKVQRGHFFCIVDECDSILIDEARTPLIISAPAAQSNELYAKFAKLAQMLDEDKDYTVDEKDRNVFLTEEGIKKAEHIVGVENLWANFEHAHHLENALKALTLFKKDVDYIVKGGEIFIVDEFTGRVLPGRRYSEGLHQAIEAKEGVEVKKESRTMATISYQNYFRMYKYLSGMTGTAMTESEEFADIYDLDVVAIPTFKPIIRKDSSDVVYKTQVAKFNAVVQETIEMQKIGRPVLIGTTSIENSEVVSNLLLKAGIRHEVLNAKHHEKEATIVAKAGDKGAVTVATNMAGRGTDIKLTDEVKGLGGLHIVGTERHESRRIDNQLRGRCGRLGDPGSTRFFTSLEDDLIRRFGGDMMTKMLDSIKIEDDMPIESRLITGAIQEAQKKVENVNFEIRKHLVEYDDVLNNHRGLIYSLRDKLLSLLEDEQIRQEKNIKKASDVEKYFRKVDPASIDTVVLAQYLEKFSLLDTATWNNDIFEPDNYLFSPTRLWVLQKLFQTVDKFMAASATDDSKLDPKETTQIIQNLSAIIPEERLEHALKQLNITNLDEVTKKFTELKKIDDKLQLIHQIFLSAHVSFYMEMNVAATTIERVIAMSTIDRLWTEHLDAMHVLREGISLRSYAQKDPLIEYKNEGFQLFQQMLEDISSSIANRIFKVKKVDKVPASQTSSSKPTTGSKGLSDNSTSSSGGKSLIRSAVQSTIKKDKNKNKTAKTKVGRNDPCPCGSGKKYKKCCYPKYG